MGDWSGSEHRKPKKEDPITVDVDAACPRYVPPVFKTTPLRTDCFGV
jgi:hypothetical protein